MPDLSYSIGLNWFRIHLCGDMHTKREGVGRPVRVLNPEESNCCFQQLLETRLWLLCQTHAYGKMQRDRRAHTDTIQVLSGPLRSIRSAATHALVRSPTPSTLWRQTMEMVLSPPALRPEVTSSSPNSNQANEACKHTQVWHWRGLVHFTTGQGEALKQYSFLSAWLISFLGSSQEQSQLFNQTAGARKGITNVMPKTL